jgi:hypothetical protein
LEAAPFYANHRFATTKSEKGGAFRHPSAQDHRFSTIAKFPRGNLRVFIDGEKQVVPYGEERTKLFSSRTLQRAQELERVVVNSKSGPGSGDELGTLVS